MSPDYHHSAGIIKLPARKSFDELSRYGLLILCNYKNRDKDKKDDTEIKGIFQEHLRKKRVLMRRKETQRLGKLKRLEILCLR